MPYPERGRNILWDTLKRLSLRELFKGVTNREQDVLRQMLMGQTNKEISRELHISEQAVKNHVYSVFRKFGFRSRGDLYRILFEYFLVHAQGPSLDKLPSSTISVAAKIARKKGGGGPKRRGRKPKAKPHRAR